MLEQALKGARLLYAYTMYIEAPIEEVFLYTGEPAYWTRDFNGNTLPNVGLSWEGKPFTAGSRMTLSRLRADGTATPVGAVPMELLQYARNEELSFRFLVGNHLIYRFVYERASPTRTEFTVNVLIDSSSSPINSLRQRMYRNKRRKASIADHLKVKKELEARARAARRG
jgi:hypothetical protein